MFLQGRGRGKLPQWPMLQAPLKLAGDGDICVGKQKKLSIVRTYTRGRGLSINVIIKQFGSNENDENENVQKCLAPRCTRLLSEGLFADTSHVTNLSEFPERILKIIFSYVLDVKTLSSCERVCRRWKSLLSNPEFNPLYYSKKIVKHIRVRRVNFMITNKVLSIECHYERFKQRDDGEYMSILWQLPAKWASRQCILSFIKSIFVKFRITSGLSFEKFDIWKDLLQMVVKYQPQIANLRFLRCFIQNDALAALSPIKQLRNFAVDQCAGYSEAISTSLISLLVKSNNINYLELCGLNQLIKIDDSIVDSIIDRWKYQKIHFLKLTNCPNVSTLAISRLVEQNAISRGKGPLIIFLENTGFDKDCFLKLHKFFKVDNKTSSSSRRVLLRGTGTLIWVTI